MSSDEQVGNAATARPRHGCVLSPRLTVTSVVLRSNP